VPNETLHAEPDRRGRGHCLAGSTGSGGEAVHPTDRRSVSRRNPLLGGGADGSSDPAQNERNRDITEEQILALDKQWRDETKADAQPIIAQLIGNPLSQYLLQIQARSLGLYPEIFIIDAKGLNVGQSSVTTDYWQGDEAKWQKTFAVGPEAVFIDEVEFHEKTRTHRVQVNMTVIDPVTAKPSGAITVEVNLDELQRRKAAPTT